MQNRWLGSEREARSCYRAIFLRLITYQFPITVRAELEIRIMRVGNIRVMSDQMTAAAHKAAAVQIVR